LFSKIIERLMKEVGKMRERRKKKRKKEML
jgi:hypothetical protein